METYTCKKWLQLLKECYSHCQEDKKEFICVYYHCKKNLKMRINEHRKKGCDKDVDSKRNPLKLKLYPPLRNAMKGVYLTKGGNIIEYRAKANALSKSRNSRPSTTLVLHPVQTSEHKYKKEKTLALEICNKVEKEFVIIYNKHLTKHGGQVIKQVLNDEPEKIFERLVSLKPIIWEKSQHNGIGSHLFYLNLQHCNVSLNFDKIQLAIVKCSQMY